MMGPTPKVFRPCFCHHVCAWFQNTFLTRPRDSAPPARHVEPYLVDGADYTLHCAHHSKHVNGMCYNNAQHSVAIRLTDCKRQRQQWLILPALAAEGMPDTKVRSYEVYEAAHIFLGVREGQAQLRSHTGPYEAQYMRVHSRLPLKT